VAEQIITQWNLAVLRAGLDFSQRTPVVTTRLDGYASGSDVTYWQRTDPLQAFGLSNSPEVPRQVRLPEGLVKAVRTTMRRELKRETALWLRLKPPYGYLGAARWEDLAADIAVPVLRVPDRLPAATTLGQKWRVAMVVNAPGRARWGARHAHSFIRALQASFYGYVEVDLFADAHTHQLLMQADDLADASVRVHDPRDALPAHERRTRHSQSYPDVRRRSGLRVFEPSADPRLFWADWIISGLGDSAARAFHVAAAGIATSERPGLAISPDPSRSVGFKSCAHIEAADIGALADSLGASLVSIAAPEARGPDVGARMVADGLGQLRPGPTIFSSIRRDQDGQALADVHAFLASPGARELPTHRSWFGYIQPESIQPVLTEPLLPHHTDQQVLGPASASDLAIRSLTPDSHQAVAATYRYADDVPVWVASSSRFLESKHADLSNAISIPGEGKASKHAYDLGTSEALNDIQGLLERHVRGS
jgi:hypothetical protein